MENDEEGQTEAGVKEIDRLTWQKMDQQILGPWTWRESLRFSHVLGSSPQVAGLSHVSANRDLRPGMAKACSWLQQGGELLTPPGKRKH